MIGTRRQLMIGGLAIAGTLAATRLYAGDTKSSAAKAMTPLQKFMRIRSSEPGRRTFWWYSGQLLGRVGDTPLRPLFTIVGASQTIAKWNDDGSIAYEMVEAGYYGDTQTGEIADSPLQNQLTGDQVQPESYLSRQTLNFTEKLIVLPAKPLPPEQGSFSGTITPPDEKGDRIWMAERLLGMLYPTAQSAPRVFNSMANFEASRHDVYGDQGFVPATMQYTTLNSFRPWMNMGDAAGNIVSRLNAVKIDRWNEIDARLRERIEADHSGVFAVA